MADLIIRGAMMWLCLIVAVATIYASYKTWREKDVFFSVLFALLIPLPIALALLWIISP